MSIVKSKYTKGYYINWSLADSRIVLLEIINSPT